MVTCLTPNITNIFIVNTTSIPAGGVWQKGDEITYGCLPGFTLETGVAFETTKCQPNGWTGTSPECVAEQTTINVTAITVTTSVTQAVQTTKAVSNIQMVVAGATELLVPDWFPPVLITILGLGLLAAVVLGLIYFFPCLSCCQCCARGCCGRIFGGRKRKRKKRQVIAMMVQPQEERVVERVVTDPKPVVEKATVQPQKAAPLQGHEWVEMVRVKNAPIEQRLGQKWMEKVRVKNAPSSQRHEWVELRDLEVAMDDSTVIKETQPILLQRTQPFAKGTRY